MIGPSQTRDDQNQGKDRQLEFQRKLLFLASWWFTSLNILRQESIAKEERWLHEATDSFWKIRQNTCKIEELVKRSTAERLSPPRYSCNRNCNYHITKFFAKRRHFGPFGDLFKIHLWVHLIFGALTSWISMNSKYPAIFYLIQNVGRRLIVCFFRKLFLQFLFKRLIKKFCWKNLISINCTNLTLRL